MDTPTHPDPFHDAWSHGLQRAVQVASSAATGAQAYAFLKKAQGRTSTARDQRARRAENAQSRVDRDAARAAWTPALDRGWIRRADVLQTARAWGAAMPYAEPATPWHEPTATTAMRNCEDRLRELHPRAMARYDRLRQEGAGPAEAMHEAAFLFAGPPRAHDPDYTPRRVLEAGNGETPARDTGGPSPVPGDLDGPGAADAQERRGRQIIEEMRARARGRGESPPTEAEQRILLDRVTNLPGDVIDRVVRTGTTSHAARACRADRPWQQDFPLPIKDVVAAAAGQARAASSTTETPAVAPAKTSSQARPAGLRP